MKSARASKTERITEVVMMSYRGKRIILIGLFLVAISFLFSVSPAVAANRYWVGVTNPDNWDDPINWSDTSGGLGGAGVPGTSDTAIFDGGNTNSCQIDISSTVASVIIYSTYTATLSINPGNSLTTSGSFEIAGGIFTTSGELLEVGSYSQTGGIFNAGGSTVICNGDFSVTGGTFNAGASTLVMDGNNKGLAGAGQTLNNLTISGAIGANSDVTIDGTLTVDANKTLQIAGNYTVKMAAGSRTTLNGTMDGPGTLELIDSAGTNLGTSGTLRTKVRFHTESANVTVPARTYGGGIELYNDSATDHTATLGTAGSQTVNCSGNFFLAADDSGNITVDANTYDPTIDIEGNIDYAGTGAGTESISMGSGTWYVGGYIDFTDGTVTAGPSTLILDGTTSGYSALGTGMDQPVSALTVYNNGLIAGGESASYIAKWDGSSWSALGTGMDSDVLALTVYNNELIAGGWFTQAGAVSANRIAKWDDSYWSALGTGMNSAVLALTVYNNELIAGGRFTQASGVSANRIAKWDGSSWSALGTGMDDYVYALTVYNNELIAGGRFTQAGAVSANRIAKWNGSSWSSLGTGMDDTVYTLTVYNNELIAGGTFAQAGAVSANRIAKWNGSSWSSLGTGMNLPVLALTFYNNELIAGGVFTQAGEVFTNRIAKWDGSSWSGLGTGMDNTVLALTVYNNELIPGGEFTQAGGVSASTIAQYTTPAFITSSRQSLNNLTIENISSDGVTFSDNVTALTFVATTTDVNLYFTGGSTATFTNITLNGQAESSRIVLRSTSPGTTWYLNVSGTQSVFYVDVQDSDASGGETILATDSVDPDPDSGRNINWFFRFADTVQPREPCGIKGRFLNPEIFEVSWSRVTKDTEGENEIVEGYNVYRATSTEGPWNLINYVGNNVFSSTDAVNGDVYYYYRIKAEDIDSNESKGSMIVDTTEDINVIAVADDDARNQKKMSKEINSILYKGNLYDEDIKIILERNNTEETDGDTITCYDIKAMKADSENEIEGFKFNGGRAKITLHYQVKDGKIGDSIPASEAPKRLAIYWFNGIEWIKLGGEVDKDRQTVTVRTRHLSKFAIKKTFNPGGFRVTSVWPKIFTPYGEGIHKTVKIYFEGTDPDEAVVGKIFDITGALVYNNLPRGDYENSLVWDGRFRNGRMARSGIYIYQVESRGKVINGTIVLAK